MTGLGVALGDAFYSGLGLFGMATLITQCEEIFSLIKIVGGAYLLWFARTASGIRLRRKWQRYNSRFPPRGMCFSAVDY